MPGYDISFPFLNNYKSLFNCMCGTGPLTGVGVDFGGLCSLGVGTKEGQGRALLLTQVNAVAVTVGNQQLPDKL